jgi:hypothetical protein
MLLCLVFLPLVVLAQDIDTAWVRTYNGPGNDTDGANAIGLDAAGNVYVTGASWGSGTNYDLATIKYEPDGTQLWVSRYDGPANGPDDAHALVVDDSGNVCVTGPILASGPANYDYATIKYGSSYGTQLWFKGMGGGGTDVAQDIGMDGSGNFYVTGYFYTSPTWYLDFVTAKYASDGTPLWSRNFNGPVSGDDSASTIAVTISGDVYVTGQAKVTPMTRGYGTVKYNSSGSQIWSRYYVGPGGLTGYALAIAVDGSGNVYVTGKSLGSGTGLDYATIKYDAAGNQLWVQRYNGPGNGHDEAYAIAVDDYGNVYVTGFSVGSGTYADYATVKYDPSGTELWVQRYNGPGNYTDKATDLALDGSGNVYVTGWSIQSGSGSYFDMATLKYTPEGTLLWEKRYNGPANISDGGNAIDLDNSGNVYVTGYCDQGSGSGDYVTIKYWQNYSPDPFSLISPEHEASFPPGYVDFDWEDSVDPDLWDEVRYDLYLSTSQTFHPDSTVVYDSLLTSEYSENFASGTYYWKVRAYDNHTELWSNQTWSFVVIQPIFGSAVDYEVGNFPHSVFCADLDGDGDLDLAVANHESQNVSILKNYGNGTFTDAVNYTVATQPLCVFCGELDGDGDLDLAVSCVPSGVFILKNNGDGTFVDAGNYPGSGLRFLFCADLDEDDDLDIVVTTVSTDEVFVLMNNGDGTFVNAGSYAVGSEPVYPFCADLDADGDLDLAVSNAYGEDISILKNNGDGTFQPKVNYPVEDGPHSVFAIDLDGDSDLDLAVANGYEESGDSVSVLMNNGDGTFGNAINYKVGPRALFLFSSDIDGDADFDLTVANSWSDNISILKNNEDGTFAEAVNSETPSGPMYPFCADLDGDGDFDLAVTIGYSGQVVSILENLTQIPANQPPHPFSLLSPADADSESTPVTLDWRTPYDPNLGDQIRYDLYVSTVANFDPDSTAVYDSLVISRLTDSLKTDTYYWKVRAYDNWGASCWSDESQSFCVFLYGDANTSGTVEPGDVVYLINYLFRNGPSPDPYASGDSNCDGEVGPGDVVYLINYLFRGGPPPSC